MQSYVVRVCDVATNINIDSKNDIFQYFAWLYELACSVVITYHKDKNTSKNTRTGRGPEFQGLR